MADPDHFDVLIVGAGQAGVPLAHALAGAGRRVAIAERARLGGSCVNFGCTPTKAAIASAAAAHAARRAAEFGIGVGAVTVDFPAVLARARAIAEESRLGLERGLADPRGPLLLRGHARLTGRAGAAFTATVGDRAVTASGVVLDTGTRTRMPELPGLDAIDVLHAGNWLDHPVLPEHVVMLGGGVIALEMSQFYRRMGSRVTLLGRSERLAEREDRDVSDALQNSLEREGVTVRLGTRVERVARDGAGVQVQVRDARGVEALRASHLFVAVGRAPNTDDLGLETVGVAMDPGGIVRVDERLATTVPGVWAAGDIRGGPQFTHTSWDDHRVLRSQLLGDGTRTTKRIVPYGVFTDPELGRVGVTEAEARASGAAIDVLRYDLARNGRARESGDTGGFIKVIVEVGSRRILGAAVLAAHGAELVHLYVDLMNAGAPATVMRDAVHAHPTLAEAAQSAVASA